MNAARAVSVAKRLFKSNDLLAVVDVDLDLDVDVVKLLRSKHRIMKQLAVDAE